MILLAFIKTVARIVRVFDRHWKIPAARKKFEGFTSSILFKNQCDHTDVSIKDVKAEWVKPEEEENGRVILYLHGGAFISGSPGTHRHLISQLCRAAKARALVIGYRLAPENPYPAAIEDVLVSYKWLLSEGFTPEKISVMGDSAGGGLALVLLQAVRDSGFPLPACIVCISPWADLSCSGASMIENARKDALVEREMCIVRARHYAGDLDLRSPSLSPLFGDLSGLPPLLIHVGSEEVLLDDARRLAEKAGKSGMEVDLQVWPKMVHVWHFMSMIIPDGRRAIKDIGSFVISHTAAKK